MPPKGKPEIDAAVDELIGGDKPASKPAATSKPTPGKAAKTANKKAAGKKPENVLPDPNKYLGKKASDGAAKSKPAPAVSGSKGKSAPANKKQPAPANKTAKTKKATATSGTRGPRGSGKFYFDPKARGELVKKLRQVKAPTTTKAYADKHNLPTWQVRLAAVDLVAEKAMTLKKDGAVLVMHPK